MRSKFDGTCKLCNKPCYKGSTIVPLSGSYVHPACKAKELARRLSQGSVTALPGHEESIEGWASRKQATQAKARRGIPFSGL